MQEETTQATSTQEVKAKRTAKNSVFLDLFKDKKYLLALYKTLHPRKYGMTEQAIKETIRICKDRNVLKEYLESKETERKTAERMIKKGKMTLEEIADYVPSLSFDDLKEIETEIMQLA